MNKAERDLQKKINAHLSELALRMALHCVRNTIIEDYHAQGKISDPEMKAFNKEVVNKLYTFLQLVLNPKYEELQAIAFRSSYIPGNFYLPLDWDEPKLNNATLGFLRKQLLQLRVKKVKK